MPDRQRSAIRPDADGALDAVAIRCDLFRLERMNRHLWWLTVSRGDQQTVFWIRHGRAGIRVVRGDDTIGCVDDRCGVLSLLALQVRDIRERLAEGNPDGAAELASELDEWVQRWRAETEGRL